MAGACGGLAKAFIFAFFTVPQLLLLDDGNIDAL